MRPDYRPVSDSLVASHPNAIGVVSFYGGAFVGSFPTTAYEYFLNTLYAARYSIIAVPFQLGFNHYRIAEKLLVERDEVRRLLPAMADLPHFWVGHSLGCKFIALLEALTEPETNLFLVPGERVNIASRRGILHEPALLMAPDISDTRDVVMVPILPEVLEAFGVGVRPTRAETQRLITTSSLFGLTALLSFSNDTLAGTESGPPETSDVAWFAQLLRARFGERFLHREIPGDHLQPTGIRVGDTVYAPDLRTVLDKDPIPRQLETVALEFLTELHTRIGSAAPTLRSAPTGTWVGAV